MNCVNQLKLKMPRMKVAFTPFGKAEMLFLSFVFVEIGTFLLRTSYLFRNALLLIIGTLSIFLCLVSKGIKKNESFLAFIIIYTVCGIISWLVNQNADIQELLWPLAYMGFGLILLNYKLSFWIVKWTYIIVSLIFAVMIIVAGGVDNLVLQSSRNSVSIYELQLWSFYAISAYQYRKILKFWSLLLGLLVSAISIGRGGILTFMVMLAFYMLYKYDRGETKPAGFLRFAAYGVLLVCTVIILYNSRFYEMLMQMIDNLKLRGLETKRTLIWSDYYKNVKHSIMYVLFGAPQRGTFWLDKYADNLHNSFFELHAKYGLGMLLFVVCSLINRIAKFWKEKKIYLFIPLIGMIVRMNLDYTNFNAMLDTLFIYFLLYPKYNNVCKVENVKRERITNGNNGTT